MKIAILQDTYLPKVDGVQVSTENFRLELIKRGHEVLVVAPRHPSYGESHEGYFLMDAFPCDFLFPGLSMGKTWKAHISQVFGSFKPDIIHSMSEFTIGYFYARKCRKIFDVPRVHTFHTFFSQYVYFVPRILQGAINRAVPKVTKKLSEKSIDSIVVPTEAMQHYFQNDCQIIEPVHVIPNGIDLQRFTRSNGLAFRTKHQIALDEKVILSLGRISQDKLIEVIISTVALLRKRGIQKLRLVIVGVGPKAYIRKLEKHASSEGVNDIIWEGYVSGQEWLDCYGAADLNVVPSITETFCLSVLESFAAGVPAIATNQMGTASVMKGEKGGLFALPNAIDCADKAERLLIDKELWHLKSREALERANEYSIERCTAKLEALYESIIKKS